MKIRSSVLRVPESEFTNRSLLLDLQVDNPTYLQQLKFSRYKPSAPKFIKGYKVEDGYFLLPRNFLKVRWFKDETNLGDSITQTTNIQLREEQLDFIDNKFNPARIEGHTDLVVNLTTGFGKTVLALYIAAVYGRRTLIVVTQVALMNQFKDSVKKFAPNWTVGRYTGEKLFDINIVTYQLLAGASNGKAKTEEFYKPFGHIVLDEYHRAGAEKFNSVNLHATCKYRTSLTATFRREDGMEKILIHHAGVMLRTEAENREHATVYPIDFRFDPDLEAMREYSQTAVGTKYLRDGEQVKCVARKSGDTETGVYSQGEFFDSKNKVTKVTALNKYFVLEKTKFADVINAFYEDKTVIDLTLKLIEKSLIEKRTIILIANRLEFLYYLYEKLNNKKLVGMAIGDKPLKTFCKNKNLDFEKHKEFTSKKARVILGIEKIAREGMDIERADTLILTRPIAEVEQAVGRIGRIFKNKQKQKVYYYLPSLWMLRKNFFSSKKIRGAKDMFEGLGHTVESPININNLNSIL